MSKPRFDIFIPADKKLVQRLAAAAQRDGFSDLDAWIKRTLLQASVRKRPAPQTAPPSNLPPGYRRWRFSGTLDARRSATTGDVLAYLDDAVGTMCGCYEPPGGSHEDSPGHPMWGVQNVQGLATRLAPPK